MKIANIRRIPRMLVSFVFFFLLGLFTASAQIGPLGVYGAPPESYRANVRYARIEINTGIESIWHYDIPVNGLGNFNFYYTADGAGFLSGGDYVVSYWNAARTTSYGYDTVTYSPNSGHTNGAQVRAFNNPPSTPRGIHGIVRGQVPNGGGDVVAPIENAVVTARSSGSYSAMVKTNANGFFSIYYNNENPVEFLWNIQHWDIGIYGKMNGCVYEGGVTMDQIVWHPDNPTDPSLPSYYVDGAEFDVTIAPLSPSAPCHI